MRQSAVASLLDITRAFDRSGGGMLAGALAYFGFFTLVPALLLFVGLLGILIEDRALRAQLIDGLVDQIDPVADVARFIVTDVADTGRIGTVIGIVGLLWGASGFYGALQGAMQRLFPGPGGRDFLNTRIRGVVTVVFILGSMLAAVVVVFALPLLTDALNDRCTRVQESASAVIRDICSIDLVQIGGVIQLVGVIGVAILAALVVYVAVPPNGPTLRQALLPAIIAGTGIGLFTALFGLVAPYLVRQWLTLGLVGSVFIALIWFNLVFQALVYGAAFARVRRDRDRLRDGPPHL
jgi:membrane protein